MNARRTKIAPWMSIMMVLSVAGVAAAQMAQPTKEHEILKEGVGTWDGTIKLFSAPGEEPAESKCTETVELVGGMWLVSKFEGEIMGTPFEGRGTSGYDPEKKKYVGTWIDSVSPTMMLMEGDYDPATKTLTATAEGRDPASGEKVIYKEISRTIDQNTRSFEMQIPGENGEYWTMMTIEYKRRGKK